MWWIKQISEIKNKYNYEHFSYKIKVKNLTLYLNNINSEKNVSLKKNALKFVAKKTATTSGN